MLAAVTEVVFEMVALVFEGVEGLVFNFPAGTAGFDQFNDVLPAHRLVGYPAVMIICFLIDNEPILKKAHLVCITGAV